MNEVMEALSHVVYALFITFVGFCAGVLFYWAYVGNNSVCSDRACIYLHDKTKILEYNKL